MAHAWVLNYFNEFFGTMILIMFGNGSVANSFLRETTGNPGDTRANGGWVLISFAFGFGVMIPSMLFGIISINPAVTIATAVAGTFPWVQVVPYILCQVFGAICGQLLVVAIYWPYFKKTTNSDLVFACFSTFDHVHNKWNGFITEIVGTAVMMFVAIGLYRGLFFKQSTNVANIGVGFLIAALVMGLGGPTGPALNPARDFGPRLVFSLLPIPNKKGHGHWAYAWIPIVGPIIGGIVGIFCYKIPFGL